jgi:hypothetical protein
LVEARSEDALRSRANADVVLPANAAMNETVGQSFRGPDFHDGALTGLRVVDKSTLELYCSTHEGDPYTVSLPGLEALNVDNFLQGNIIFEIELFTANFPIELVKRAFSLSAEENPPWLQQKITQMTDEGWTLLELSSSYGCELAAIAKGKLEIQRL